MFRTIGLASDALVMRGRSVFEKHDGYIVQRTPMEPDYWHGNQVIFQVFPETFEDAWRVFRHSFPLAKHCVFTFDLPSGHLPEWTSGLPGFEIDQTEILVLEGSAKPARPILDFHMSQIVSDADWAKLVDLQHQTEVEQGLCTENDREYIDTKFRHVRSQCEDGNFAWFGLFEGKTLAADMGVTWDSKLARFQSVETRKEYRRNGLCGALLSEVLAYLSEVAPHAAPVIAAAADGAPGRIYRRAGFIRKETIVSFERGAM